MLVADTGLYKYQRAAQKSSTSTLAVTIGGQNDSYTVEAWSSGIFLGPSRRRRLALSIKHRVHSRVGSSSHHCPNRHCTARPEVTPELAYDSGRFRIWLWLDLCLTNLPCSILVVSDQLTMPATRQ